jgi:recombinational DNA repair ATPase RecF
MKVRSLEISGLRGVRRDLSITLDSSKSILIYGDNGSGKSSITDALEWFYYDKVEHLSTEEIGTKGIHALRNVFLSDDEDAYIELKYSDSKYDSKKRLFLKKSKLTIEHTNATQAFNDYIDASLKDNLILRYKDLLRFILSTKTEKLKEISNIIGFSEVSRIKDVFKKAANELKNDLKRGNFDNHINAKQSLIMNQIGQNIWNDEQYLHAINELVVPLKLQTEIKDIASIDNILELIKKPEDKEALTQQLSYEKVIESLSSLTTSIEDIRSFYEKFYKKYQEISKDIDKFKKISLEKLLSEGLSVLEKRIFEDDKCPLCLQEKSRDELIDELRKRVEELAVFKKEKDELLEEKSSTQRFIQNTLIEIETILKEKCLLLEENSEIKKEVENLKGLVSKALESIKKFSLIDLVMLSAPEEFICIDNTIIQRIVSILSTKKEKIITGKKDDLVFSIHGKILSVNQAYAEIESLKRASDILTQQQQSMELIYNEFVKKQREGLYSFLESISKDINDLYLFMNDSENVSEIKLIPLDSGDEFAGITLQFKFHSKPESPPHKYLSESHLNCLGICLFLASVKTFNKTNKLFVLDDVISSFDKIHRGRFARLLIEKFSDYQIFLFTHERDWFEYVSNMVKGKNWEVKKIIWDHENGASIEVP